jgi:predicted nucleotidyltransferase component of viral defense system
MEKRIREDVSCYASQAQQSLLGKMSAINLISENFFATGGTTLSVFYLHHRLSEDLDLFSVEFRDLGSVDSSLKRVFGKDLSLVQSSLEFYSYLINGIKVDIVFDPLSTDEKRAQVTLAQGRKIYVDTLDNIASNKLSATARRTEPKDLIDFYFIGKLIWKEAKKDRFVNCYDLAKQKEALFDDPPTAAYQIEALLDRVLEEKEKALPPMKKQIEWESLEKDIRFYIDTIYRMGVW